jgi:hypothetical protein
MVMLSLGKLFLGEMGVRRLGSMAEHVGV